MGLYAIRMPDIGKRPIDKVRTTTPSIPTHPQLPALPMPFPKMSQHRFILF